MRVQERSVPQLGWQDLPDCPDLPNVQVPPNVQISPKDHISPTTKYSQTARSCKHPYRVLTSLQNGG
eukprot:364003-Chlamydomonas_euryale.AAC.50